MASEGHNGWSNYETWAVNLWLTNEEQHYIQPNGQGAQGLAKELREEVERGAPDLGNSMYGDLLWSTLREVNWLEIAEAMLAGGVGDD